MTRHIIALACGILSGYLVGQGLNVNASPAFVPAVGVASGAVTSLVSWKHVPGLPGMAFALAVAALGFSSSRNGSGEERWMLDTVESLWTLVSLLFVYTAAWAMDTYAVFRRLTVKPPSKQIGAKRLLTRLLPCCLLTGVGGIALGFFLPLPVLLSVPLTFILCAFLTSHLSQTRSTLWFSLSAPLGFVLLGSLILAQPHLAASFRTPSRLFALCGLGSAGAIAGHWVWVRLLTRHAA
jgi:hypothetical protein